MSLCFTHPPAVGAFTYPFAMFYMRYVSYLLCVPHVPTCFVFLKRITYSRAIHVLLCYVPSYITCLCALCALVPNVPYLPYVTLQTLRIMCALRVLTVLFTLNKNTFRFLVRPVKRGQRLKGVEIPQRIFVYS